MYCTHRDREAFEDDLYKEDDGDSEDSEANSELDFHLYSQLHYSSNAGDMEEQLGRGEEVEEGRGSLQPEVTELGADVGGDQEDTDGSRHQLQQRPEKPDIQKKRRVRVTKGQKSSALLFEEVIVIDSSTDVISISEGDSGDDDDGVCAFKGKGTQRCQTSAPPQQGAQKRKQGLGAPVIVDSSCSESSDSESTSPSEPSDSSDSDYLENWMILGRANQDGDQSISLNLEGGGSDSEADVEEEGTWLVSDKDKQAQIYNKDKGARTAVQRVSHRYYTSKNVQCRNCNKYGHLSKNCPESKLSSCFLCGTPGHMVSQCTNRHCNNCGLPGHNYESCSERPYWHKQCHRCSMTGHFFDACPEIWRQYHITTKAGTPVTQQTDGPARTPAYCYNCSKEGHFGHTCTRQRMFNGTYPNTPFINHYDTTKDINCRQHRIRLKVKELKKNGFFTAGSQIPPTPVPPKKKQKTIYRKNNYQPNHKPHQSPNDPQPSPSHIIFTDKYDFKAPTSKTKKCTQQESTSTVKTWKPKRPVPTSRDVPTKLIFDEAHDFPRGGGKSKVREMKRHKRMKNPVAGKGQSDGRPNRPCWTGEIQRSRSKPERGRRMKRNQTRRIANKNVDAQVYPTDENLFTIKQRKRSR
ncbi:zinc finger CCHC domain-containing protein 7 [Brachionichthys hirsutus]|uniref:zinc finger CCHC domain-containing protein 7 n=1 Tax=Brachionichthys hirsutus TaxID=412623 RepID=UPI0036049E5D